MTNSLEWSLMSGRVVAEAVMEESEKIDVERIQTTAKREMIFLSDFISDVLLILSCLFFGC